jgi:hypothetical protein
MKLFWQYESIPKSACSPGQFAKPGGLTQVMFAVENIRFSKQPFFWD